jgi:fermentation-respiration switch protein FrsA (DUF1100 family)
VRGFYRKPDIRFCSLIFKPMEKVPASTSPSAISKARTPAAAIAYLKQVAPGERIGVIGVSMGGAAATLAAPPLNIDALVLEMVYPTIKEAVDDRLTMRLGGWARVLTPLLLLQSRAQLGFSSNNLRPIDHVGQLTFPKLFIAGANDRHTTLDESRRLFEAASSPKDFWVVPGAAHVDLHRCVKG